MKNLNLENVQEAKDFTPVPPDGYICRITSVEDVPDKEYLRVEFDIAEGDFKGNYQTLYENKGVWGGSFVRSYKEKGLPFFKSFTTAIENSNPGYKFDNDENKLRNKLVGLVLAEEEYVGNDNKVKTRLYVDQIRSIDKIRSGDFKIPEKKILAVNERPGAASTPIDIMSDEDLPFN